jgi:5-methylcytosine-specific restriction endonuclease McrA
MKYNPESASILSLHSSHFNSKKLMKMCEKCGKKMAEEMHHIKEQKWADSSGFIKEKDGTVFHKNHKANLMALCESCHNEVHMKDKKDSVKKNAK